MLPIITTLVEFTWGVGGDVPVPGDCDNDGTTDFATFTPATGVWSVRSWLAGTTLVGTTWGMAGDLPVPGDYDGDGVTDIAVYRPSSGAWYVMNVLTIVDWGNATDVPILVRR
jgi:hypothetical protein